MLFRSHYKLLEPQSTQLFLVLMAYLRHCRREEEDCRKLLYVTLAFLSSHLTPSSVQFAGTRLTCLAFPTRRAEYTTDIERVVHYINGGLVQDWQDIPRAMLCISSFLVRMMTALEDSEVDANAESLSRWLFSTVGLVQADVRKARPPSPPTDLTTAIVYFLNALHALVASRPAAFLSRPGAPPVFELDGLLNYTGAERAVAEKLVEGIDYALARAALGGGMDGEAPMDTQAAAERSYREQLRQYRERCPPLEAVMSRVPIGAARVHRRSWWSRGWSRLRHLRRASVSQNPV